MSRGWEAVSRIGEGLLARGERKRQLDDERKYLAEQAAIEEERALEKAKVLQQLRDDNKAAAEAAKAAREQVLNLGDGQVGIYSNDPDGKIRFRIEGERRPTKGQIITTDAGVFDYDSSTGGMKRLGNPKPSVSAWNDPSAIGRGLEGEKSRALLDLDRDIAATEAKLGASYLDNEKNAYRAQIQQLQNMRSSVEKDYNSRIQRAGGSSQAAPAPKGGGNALMDILGNAAKTAWNYGRNEDSTMRGVASGAVPMDVGASALSAQSGQPVSLSIGGSQASASPPNKGPARPKAEEAKGRSPAWAKAYAEAIELGATPEQARVLADEVEAEAASGG